MAISRRPSLLMGSTVALAVALFLAAAVGLDPGSTQRSTPVGSSEARVDPAAIADSGQLVTTLQARLRSLPKDYRSWSELALAYVEQGRITADPTYYRKADLCVARSAALAPHDSVLFAARATLAAARHDFAGGLRDADRALAINRYSAQASAIRSDALTELGHYRAARREALRADQLDPGSSTFARLSYQHELHGDLPGAIRLMRSAEAAADARAPSYAYAAFHLGELARVQGRRSQAAHDYAAALGADPTYMPAVAGQARLAVARGDIATAVLDYRRVVRRLPLTEYVVELGELYQATGRPGLARQQWSVALATDRLFRANGVATDLETALFQADHGSPAAALTAARAEWGRRHSIASADALGWALHANGRNQAALRYVRMATRLGTPDARLQYHRGVVEAELALPTARTYLRAARRLDGGANPLRDRAIARLLGGTA
ncbi:MAG: hypothetical protein QOJ60_447 [Actinomycetota bacterium]|jgi:tetratricopeptide (TPR) repeat protein|nr:hypothetical protein [Actinomycetota bacterium]